VAAAGRPAREAVKHEGAGHEGHRQLIEILMRHDRHAEAAEAAMSLLDSMGDHREQPTCESCGAPIAEGGWRCGSCGTWLTRAC
jgi:lipopolysaccharide biosynthesis regulator YciM